MTSHPTSRRYVSQRLRLHYADWGNDAAPPLVLVHGGRDHCRSLDAVARALAPRYHVIAPDLRGHGDSDWSPDGDYSMLAFVYDLAQLVHQIGRAPVTLVAHSMGGNIAIRYAGLYPQNVARLVAIEGLGLSPSMLAEREKIPMVERLRQWIVDKRAAAARTPRRYPSLEAALQRMKDENKFLTDDMARHLTEHGATANEDGTWSWKFDNYVNVWPPFDLPQAEIHALWAAIECPTLLVYGAESWASNPEKDGRAAHFRNARVVSIEKAGHWVHHDQFDVFMRAVESFLDEPA
ncbi:MAG: alpha/beta fold hydrolase [Parvularculaceae bacterium]